MKKQKKHKKRKRQKKDISLRKLHELTARHVLVLETDLGYLDICQIVHLAELIRKAGNDLIRIMKKNLDQMKRTKRYRILQSLYQKAKAAGDEDERKKIAAEMKELQEQYNVTWDFCRDSMALIKDKYHINSIFALSKAEDVWSAVEKCLYSDGKTIHFKKYGDYSEIRAKQRNRGIVIKADENGLYFKIGDITFRPLMQKPKRTKTRSGRPIDVKENFDIFAESEIEAICNYLCNAKAADKAALEAYNKKKILVDTYRPCFASLVCKEIRGKMRVYVHITIEGVAMPKYNKDGTRRHTLGKGLVGCDIGPQSIAYVSDTESGLKNLAERGMSIKKRERKEVLLSRKMERSRRATNPENYREDGTIRKGKKKWRKSNRYRKLQKQYRNICRIAAENRHFAINEEVNHIRELGDVFVTEPGNAKKLQKRAKKTERQEKPTVIRKPDGSERTVYKYKRKKRFGRSIKNRCPGYFQAQVKEKFERSGGWYVEVPKNYRASQYDHTCDDYIKKKLSQRMYYLSDGTRVQRDWYSAFLMYCIDEKYQSVSRKKCIACFNTMYQKYLQLENTIIVNRINVMNSGITIKVS